VIVTLQKLPGMMKHHFDANRKSTGIDKLAEYFGDFVEKANRNEAA
jgi:hypothetical protein